MPVSRPKTPVQKGDTKTNADRVDPDDSETFEKESVEQETQEEFAYKKPAKPVAKESRPIVDKAPKTPAKAPPKSKARAVSPLR